mmetsp:Transcript_55331/g.147748  ORF Transcript_55331/g.147748 Transcript_55331/m.147748 type:complete len:358 (-) Transcript_55331:468-1541(-)
MGDAVRPVPVRHRLAHPEIRDPLQHRPRHRPQPLHIPGGLVVLPESHRYVTLQVLLGGGPLGRVDLRAGEGGLPGEHRPGEVVEQCVSLGLRETIRPVLQHRPSNVRVQRQVGGPHPGLHVPESVAVVPVGGQAPGAGAVVHIGPGGLEEGGQGGVDHRREVGVAAHLNPAPPQLLHSRLVRRPQARGPRRRLLVRRPRHRHHISPSLMIRVDTGIHSRDEVENLLLLRRDGQLHGGSQVSVAGGHYGAGSGLGLGNLGRPLPAVHPRSPLVLHIKIPGDPARMRAHHRRHPGRPLGVVALELRHHQVLLGPVGVGPLDAPGGPRGLGLERGGPQHGGILDIQCRSRHGGSPAVKLR